MLPESIGDLKRTGIEASGGQAMGIAGSAAKATYAAGDRRVELSITDTGGLAGLAAMAGWANMTMDKETDGKVEKVYKDGARTVHEEYRKDGSHGEVTVILANGVIVDADGEPDRRRHRCEGAGPEPRPRPSSRRRSAPPKR